MEVTEELTWSILIGRQQIESHSKQLGALPQALTSVANVRRSIEGLEALKFCTGNEDSRYFPVQAARKGVFKDPTGNSNLVILVLGRWLQRTFAILLRFHCIIFTQQVQQ